MTNGESAKDRIGMISLTMIISLWIHILGLAVWQYAEPVPAADTVIPPVALEIELPPPVDRADKKQAKSETPKDKKTESPAKPEKTPETEEPVENQAALSKPSLVPVPAGEANSGGSETPGMVPEEETISLESKAPEYVDYLSQVKGYVIKYWIFPPQAREKRETGRLTAMFTLDNEGNLLRIMVEESSGNYFLDHAALEAVRGAAPFPPFPEHINLKRLNIRANFDYRIKIVAVQ